MGRHTHPDDVERAYFRPPVPAPRAATAALPLLAEPEPELKRVWVWPTSRDTVDAIGEAVYYLTIGFFGGLGIIYMIENFF